MRIFTKLFLICFAMLLLAGLYIGIVEHNSALWFISSAGIAFLVIVLLYFNQRQRQERIGAFWRTR